MELGNSTSFENITNELCRMETVPEVELSITASRPSEIPEVLQEVKSPSGGAAAEHVMEKLKAGNGVKEKQSNDLDRSSLKRKSESNEKPAIRKEPRLLETENQPISMLLSHIPLKNLMEVEMKLVYTDEEDVTYEFLELQVPGSTQALCGDAPHIDAQTAPDMSILPQMDKWLQVALKDASACYRQKKYAVAAGQFRTALEAMIEEAITRAESFSVMYTPFATKVNAEKIGRLKEAFTKKHPNYVEYIYTEHKAPFSPLTKEEAGRHLETVGKRILPIMDFTRGTKLTETFCACSGVIEKLQHASLLGRLQRIKEQSQVINQAMAELATIPYLQDISQQDAELLQSLMADAMDTLEGRKSDKERVWNKIQKVGIIEDFLYQIEDSFLKTKKLRTARRQKMKMKRLQSEQPC